MKTCIFAAAAVLLVSLGVQSAPVEKVEGRVLTLPPFRRLVESELFAGGAVIDAKVRANIIACGQLREGTYLGLYVYDEHGNCVTWDDLGSSSTKDDNAVEWFPM